jgi:hypothetical protein
MLKAIFQSQVNIVHLLIVNIVAILLTYFIMNYVIIFIVWAYVGDGMYPKSWDFWINASLLLSAIIFLYPVVFYPPRKNYKKGKMFAAEVSPQSSGSFNLRSVFDPLFLFGWF